ncbi:microtubule associated protein-domain-containing protein [Pelagophyceae sp. CCMP2097]|nr:microtubule associated protein-domain-containing protein [Pelagophyceae sp. CCMP2097]
MSAYDASSPVRPVRPAAEAPNTIDGDECLQEAQHALLERVAVDVQHVVAALRDVWNEVGYSVDERRLQMDKMSDELTQTLRAKLACEVEVRDVFKKDIIARVRECDAAAAALGLQQDGAACVDDLRLSHALMRIEEECARVNVLRAERLARFDAAHSTLQKLAAALELDLDHGFRQVGDRDLSEERLTKFDAEVLRLHLLEAGRRSEVAGLLAQSKELHAQLASAESAQAHFSNLEYGIGKSGLIKAAVELQNLQLRKTQRLESLKVLGDAIGVLWSRLAVGVSAQAQFRERTRVCGISAAAVALGEREEASLRAELKERLSDLVAARRTRMTELWDEMEVAPEVRASFAPCYFLEPLAEGPRESDGGAAPQPFDEAALAEHDDKLAELERRRSTLQPLLRLVEKVEDLFDERTKLVAIQADPARLTRRGPGAAAERKAEMESERRLKQLPKLVERLLERIVDWEKSQGTPFVWQGDRYADRMERVEAAWTAKKSAEKVAALAKKDVSRKENMLNAVTC